MIFVDIPRGAVLTDRNGFIDGWIQTQVKDDVRAFLDDREVDVFETFRPDLGYAHASGFRIYYRQSDILELLKRHGDGRRSIALTIKAGDAVLATTMITVADDVLAPASDRRVPARRTPPATGRRAGLRDLLTDWASGPEVFPLCAHVGKLHGIGVTVEQPTDWLVEDDRLGASWQRMMFGTLMTEIACLGLPITTRPIPRAIDFQSRFAAANEILLSYHSCGSSKNVWRLKESYLPGFYTFDGTGYSGWASIEKSTACPWDTGIAQEEADAFCRTLRDTIRQGNLSKYPQPSRSGTRFPAPYCFFALQRIDDTVSQLTKVPPLDLLHAVAERARSAGIGLVVKRHPFCDRPEVADALRDLTRMPHVVVYEGSIHDVLAGASAVITVNSGVGMEALLQGIPVFTAGQSDYETACFPINRLEDIEALENRGFPWHDRNRINRFLHHYFQEYCFRPDDRVSVRRKLVMAIAEWLRLAP